MREFNILEKHLLLILNEKEQESITSMEHLEAILFLCARNKPELQEYLDSHQRRWRKKIQDRGTNCDACYGERTEDCPEYCLTAHTYFQILEDHTK